MFSVKNVQFIWKLLTSELILCFRRVPKLYDYFNYLHPSNESTSDELSTLEKASIEFIPGTNDSVVPMVCVISTSMDDLPPDIFTKTQRLQGAIVLHFFAAIYFFTILAYICSEYFLPSVECICEDLHLSEDVAAATFMATATSMPEFFTNTISTLVVDSDMGLGTIMGSMLFNTLGVAALVGLLTKSHVQLDWWPLTRDSVIVIISTSCLVGSLWDERIYWYEAVLFVILYVLYFLVMFQNNRMKKIAVELIENRWDLCRRMHPKPKDEYIESYKSTNKYSVAGIAETKNSALESPVDKEVPSSTENSTVESDKNTSSGMQLFRISTGSWLSVFWWFYTLPFRILVHVTVPNARTHRRLYPLTFLMCIVWIAATSYVVFWMMALIGETFEVPDTVMGLTFLAFGGCMPEAVSAVTVIRQGNGAMGVSNSLGANTLAILFSLGLPWFIRTMKEGGATTGAYIEINSYGMQYSVMALFGAIAILYFVLFAAKYTLRKLVGVILMVGYLVIVTFMILVELDVIFPSENTC
ncbi:sodium/potassium/calcium exchanger 3-like isoform X2 [Toxorhynchites rutilus septentrionalis]|uniref:sodium/potassium/calcium exchanger 3-like isoform X2 n=1 Tax=Toxorhynchites rutilus septentrionalis TaxID=329112 RepID=UPI002478ED74|nr:sodium/potassium/calcium exchanger 3-like isoform X2 [Toxorhynchites rutilus septentrionalis]